MMPQIVGDNSTILKLYWNIILIEINSLLFIPHLNQTHTIVLY